MCSQASGRCDFRSVARASFSTLFLVTRWAVGTGSCPMLAPWLSKYATALRIASSLEIILDLILCCSEEARRLKRIFSARSSKPTQAHQLSAIFASKSIDKLAIHPQAHSQEDYPQSRPLRAEPHASFRKVLQKGQ